MRLISVQDQPLGPIRPCMNDSTRSASGGRSCQIPAAVTTANSPPRGARAAAAMSYRWQLDVLRSDATPHFHPVHVTEARKQDAFGRAGGGDIGPVLSLAQPPRLHRVC
jgi:hypothetical protein